MNKSQKIVTTLMWAVVVLAMMTFVATRALRTRAELISQAKASGAGRQPAKFEPLYDVPRFDLIDQNSRSISNTDLAGKVWIADFIFTNCAGPCPIMTSKMSDLQKQLKNPDVKLVSFTVDPGRDTPAVLKQYADRFGADDSRWLFLTGPAGQMIEVTRGMNIAAKKEADDSVTHSTHFLLVNRAGQVCGIYRMSEEESIRQLALDADELATKTAP